MISIIIIFIIIIIIIIIIMIIMTIIFTIIITIIITIVIIMINEQPSTVAEPAFRKGWRVQKPRFGKLGSPELVFKEGFKDISKKNESN